MGIFSECQIEIIREAYNNAEGIYLDFGMNAVREKDLFTPSSYLCYVDINHDDSEEDFIMRVEMELSGLELSFIDIEDFIEL